MRLPAFGLGGLAALVLAAAPATPPLELHAPRETRERMEASLDRRVPMRVVYGTQDITLAPLLRERALGIARRLLDGDTSVVLADRDATASDLGHGSVLLLGGPGQNAWTRRLAGALPVSFTAAGFRWQGTAYERPGDALHLVWPNPLEPAHFLLLVAGNSREAILGRGTGMLFGAEDWRISRDGELVRSGEFAQGPGRPWRYDPALDRDLEAARERARRAMRVMGTGPVRVRCPPNAPGAGAALAAAEALLQRLDRMGFAARGAKAVTLSLYPSLEAKGELTRNTRPEHLDATGEAHAALAAGREALDLWSVAGARLRRLGADPDAPWLVPAAVGLGGRFEGEPLEQAVSRLYFGRLLPPASEAAARARSSPADPAAAEWRSPLVWIPARAILVRAVYEVAGRRGPQAVLALLQPSAPGTLDSLCRGVSVPTADVERRYTALADSLARAGERANRLGAPRPWRPADGFQAGVCLAHSVRLDRGYLSAACGQELARLHALGAGWVSITPFGYLPAPDSPEIIPMSDAGPDAETDEAVCEAAARARALGLRVWLKPHLWTRGFVGDLAFRPDGWERFFARYRAFILHYALLAQRERLDGLVVGHELTSATLGHPEAWRQIIAAVRRVYGGTLTYGANWGEEVKGIAFWDALDLVGVSFYAPLADAPSHDVRAMSARARKGLADLKAVGARAGRPVLIVEAGYPPRPAAAVRPWEEGPGDDPEAQRACYQALVTGLEPETWVAGVFWWKWFTSGAAGGEGEASYTPRGRPAEAVMTRAFDAWVGRPVIVPRAAGPKRAVPAPP